MSQDRIYLDHNATTPLSAAAAERMAQLLREDFGNPSSLHWAGRGARQIVDDARRRLAALVGCRPSEVVFTGGGTEADVTAMLHMAHAASSPRPRLIVGSTEHHAIHAAAHQLADRGLATIEVAPVARDGLVDLDWLAEHLPGAHGLALMWANNETGAMPDHGHIAELVTEHEVPWHCDAVQAAGKVPIDFREGPGAAVTTMALAAHKLYGPKGVGALIVRRGVELTPLMVGGSQEQGRRAGTLNVPGIAAFGVAAAEAARRLDEGYGEAVAQLRQRLLRGIVQALPSGAECVVNGPDNPGSRLPNTLHVSLRQGEQWIDGEALMLELSANGVAVSTGAACASADKTPSHVLVAMGLSAETAAASLRLSLGPETTAAQVDAAATMLGEAVWSRHR